ncbi:hypothetical protein ACFX1Q_010505 [Malus domestica]
MIDVLEFQLSPIPENIKESSEQYCKEYDLKIDKKTKNSKESKYALSSSLTTHELNKSSCIAGEDKVFCIPRTRYNKYMFADLNLRMQITQS